MSDASPESFVYAITDDIPKFDIGHKIPKPTHNDVEALLVSYRPNKIKTTDIELNITLTDDKPIYHSPRRCQKTIPRNGSNIQEVLNSTFQRSINTTPFELLFGTQINNKTNLRIQQLIDEQLQLEFNENRELLRKAAKAQIIKVQNENKKSYNLRRKSPSLYSVMDLVAIKRTQHELGQKLCNKFIGPYKITQVKLNDTYNVEKCGNFDGPTKTSTCEEYLKPWTHK
ncbi:integrase catalytic domain-containing protein [Trichonephila inaurata madagascariensis]|uniref:Integrase catalytic domain-containing protein n=1 Tax=Trichonephila inaurata madagascariensis TaxID=2747483 RepID=A0A8X7CML1_9ARAC|nr:integrase catalytic domain-containing protein [Trichonephila inaurata madagascariensis]